MKEPILTIDVTCEEDVSVKGHTKTIMMIPFTGIAGGPYFNGRTVCAGTDTQKITPDGECVLSARYILEGTDMTGAQCRVFVENETRGDGRLRPSIVTDSDALADWESAALYSEIESVSGGVIVRIYSE